MCLPLFPLVDLSGEKSSQTFKTLFIFRVHISIWHDTSFLGNPQVIKKVYFHYCYDEETCYEKENYREVFISGVSTQNASAILTYAYYIIFSYQNRNRKSPKKSAIKVSGQCGELKLTNCENAPIFDSLAFSLVKSHCLIVFVSHWLNGQI